MPFTLDQLEAFVSSPAYDADLAGAIAARVPELRAYKAAADGTAAPAPTRPRRGAPKPAAASTAAPAAKPAPGGKGESLGPGITRIRGNLCNVHGKYGPCDAALSGKPKGGKGGKGKAPKGAKPKAGAKPKQGDTERAAEQQQKKLEREQAKRDQVDQNRSAVYDALGISDTAIDAINALESGQQPENADDLIASGMAERDRSGAVRLTPTGRQALHAADRGDAGAMRDALSLGRDHVATASDRATARQTRQQATQERHAGVVARQQANAAKRAQAAAERAQRAPKRASAGRAAAPEKQAAPSTPSYPKRKPFVAPSNSSPSVSSGGPAKPRAPQPIAPQGIAPAKVVKPTKAPEAVTTPALADAARALSDGTQISGPQLLSLVRNGLARIDRDGIPILTATGLRATRQQTTTKARRVPWVMRTKEQTPQQRAMFAHMGGGGSGGSGGGAGKGGGTSGGGSKLWAKGPDGKRTPRAGFEKGGKRRPSTTEGGARAADPGKPAHGQTIGTQTKAYGTDPTKSYTMRHELVDMGDIQASNTSGGGINPHYDPSLQPRDRSRAASQAQIAEVAQKMNPEVLTTDFHRIDAGSPIIDKNGNVLSGNGRTLALQRAAELHPDKYAEYKAQIKAQAREAGIDPGAVDKMKNPVLVRRLQGDTNTVAFAREANSSGTLRMSPLEQAKVDAAQISDRHMLKLNAGEHGDIDRALRDKANKPFVDEFLATVPDNERANLLTRNGDLNQMGLYRAKAAVYTRAFPGAAGERMAESMLESLDPDVKTIQNGISGALPAFSRATSMARSGLRDSELDISHDFAKTVDVYARIKDNPALTHNTPASQVVRKYLDQSSMFDRELNADQERMLVHLDKISRKPTEVRGFLERYARMVEDAPQPGQTSLFGAADRLTRQGLLDALLGDTPMPDSNAQGSLF